MPTTDPLATTVPVIASAPARAAEPIAPREAQRAALRDLTALATDCAATEAQIEKRRTADLENAQKAQQRAMWQAEERYRQHQEQIQSKHDQRAGEIEAQHQQQTRSLAGSQESLRRQIDHDRDAVERDVKQKFEQVVWLADSVLEGTQNQVRAERRKAKELRETQLAELEDLRTRVLHRLQVYGLLPTDMPAPPPRQQAASGAEPASSDEPADYAGRKQAAEESLAHLAALKVPNSLVGATPWGVGFLLIVIAGALAQFLTGSAILNPKATGISAGVMLLLVLAATWVLRIVGKRHLDEAYVPLTASIDAADEASERQLDRSLKELERRLADAGAAREAEVSAIKEKLQPIRAAAQHRRDQALATGQGEYGAQAPRIEEQHRSQVAELEAWHQQVKADVEKRRADATRVGEDRRAHDLAEAERLYVESRKALEHRLREGLARIQTPLSESDAESAPGWDDDSWRQWTPPRRFVSSIRFGELEVDLRRIAAAVPDAGEVKLPLPPPLTMAATLGFPRQASLLIQTDRPGRAQAIATLQMVMTRLLTQLPPGRVRFTIIDPVGLGQNFAGFMHLADHDESLVGGRIWTESEHIEQRLENLTEHMETVIQKYLRNEFDTIDDYNAQAGELAEPYRFLIIADFPVGFQGDAFRRLSSIATTGARCGVYTLVMQDTRQSVPSGEVDDLIAHSVTLQRKSEQFIWRDEVFSQFPLKLDPPPDEAFLTRILDLVGQEAKQLKRVEVPFDTIAPPAGKFWSADSTSELTIPVGRMGATRLQLVKLGRGVAQHMLIAGKTGSGKSTLLHVLVTNLAMWYSPDQVEFYLVDFKKGVEFKTYASNELPHARAVAVESDREFGLSVLQRLDSELTHRGELYRKFGVQDLGSFRAASGQVMPRTLLIIDEFQEFFSEDDKLAQDAGLLLDRLVRQGRAFGIHVLLGSQTIGGTSGLARSTIGQMAVRIALQTSEADSQLILGDGNSAARLLSRPGEAIYNDAGGLVEANSPFQVSWLSDAQRDTYLERVHAHDRDPATAPVGEHQPMIVFEGNAPASIQANRRLAALLDAPEWPASLNVAQAWLGDPVAIKEATSIPLRRQSGSNALIVGQHDEAAMALLAGAIVSLAAQQPPKRARFVVIDGSPADSPLAGMLEKVAGAIPHEVKFIEYRAVPEAINELAEELTRRQADEHGHGDEQAVYVLIYGLQRYRVLRKSEESFSFSVDSSEEKKPQPDKQFGDLLREGPHLGMHLIAWADTPASIERTLDRNLMREFDNRILFQMSVNDSSNLIDSPAANKLGFHRALAYSEEQGVLEKFRPYALPNGEWLERVAAALKGRGGSRGGKPA